VAIGQLLAGTTRVSWTIRGAEAAQLGRHSQRDPRPSDPEHIVGCGDLAEEIGRDLADLVASPRVIATGGVHDDRGGERKSVRTAAR
jgi:hypothetical protein